MSNKALLGLVTVYLSLTAEAGPLNRRDTTYETTTTAYDVSDFGNAACGGADLSAVASAIGIDSTYSTSYGSLPFFTVAGAQSMVQGMTCSSASESTGAGCPAYDSSDIDTFSGVQHLSCGSCAVFKVTGSDPQFENNYQEEDVTTVSEVSFNDWKKSKKCSNAAEKWENVENGGTCQQYCEDYAIEQNYTSDFCCSFENNNGKNKGDCIISSDGNTNTKEHSKWKKSVGTMSTYTTGGPIYVGVILMNTCPYADNTKWCPKDGNDNEFGYKNHLDFGYTNDISDVTDVIGSNPVGELYAVECPSELISTITNGVGKSGLCTWNSGTQGCPGMDNVFGCDSTCN